MSYIGSSAAPVPVAFSGVRTQSFSGNGSTSLFTLNRAVSAVTAIEVVVNNVQQSPFDGSYSIVNNGVGLQFSENVSAGTNNIYVTYRDQAIGSLYDTGAVRKAGDVMSGSLSINGAASSTSLVIGRGDTSLEGGQLDLCRASDNLAAWGIDVYGSGNTPSLRVIDNIAAAVRLQIDSAGRVTMPNQPKFYAQHNTSDSASNNYGRFDSEYVNVGNCVTHSTNGGAYTYTRFTCPVAGTYLVWVGNIGPSANTVQRTYIYKNGISVSSELRTSQDVNHGTSASMTTLVTAAAGDWIATKSVADNGAIGFYSGVYSHFGVHLIG